MLLFSDLHLKPESEPVVLGEVLPGIRAACQQHGERLVGFLGDFWTLRYTVDVRLQNAVRDEFRRWGLDGIALWILPGNHDQVDLAGRNALEVFDDLQNVRVFNVPQWNDHGLWVPYRARHQDVVEALELPRPPKAPKVLFLHHGLKGAWMNNLKADDDGLPLSLFEKFDAVLCGHYHKRQQVGDRAWYVGSPWQTKADEAGQPKGYAVWDGTRLQYHDTAWGPRHYRLVIDQPDQAIDLSFARPQDRVKVEVRHAGVDTEAVARQLSARGLRPTIEHNVQHQVTQRLGTAGTIEEYVVRYAGMFCDEQSLDPGRLVQTFRELSR